MTPIHVRTTTTALRLRTRPEVTHDSDTGLRLLEGQVAEVWGTSLDDLWYYVVAPVGSGWASSSFLVEIPPPAAPVALSVAARLALREDLLPKTASNRPGTRLQPQWITIHNTANRAPGADAEMHRRYLRGQDARNRQVSWHFTVDDREVIQHIPRNEVAWHAGTLANGSSLGVEICEHVGIDQDAANDRAALLVAMLLREEGIPLSHVRTHRSWTGKQCPRVLLQTPGGWETFLARVGEHFATL